MLATRVPDTGRNGHLHVHLADLGLSRSEIANDRSVPPLDDRAGVERLDAVQRIVEVLKVAVDELGGVRAVLDDDALGQEVCFEARENDPRGPVSLGWLRVSHRALDPVRSRPFQPVLTHEQVQLIEPGQIVPVEIEILPSSTAFHAGESLRLVVAPAPELFPLGKMDSSEASDAAVARRRSADHLSFFATVR